MDEYRITKKMSNGDFYLLSFLISYLLMFGFLPIIFKYIFSLFFELKYPGFIEAYKNIGDLELSEITNPMWALNNSIQFFASLIIAILIFIFLGKSILRDIKLFKNDMGHNTAGIFFGFVLLFVINILFTRIYSLFGIVGTSDNQATILAALKSNSAFFLYLSVVILAPFVEEIIFRKLLYGIVEEKFKMPKIVSVLVSAIVFGALHAVDIYFFTYFAMGLVLCLSYSLFNNNIVVPIGIHFLNNATILLNVFIFIF